MSQKFYALNNNMLYTRLKTKKIIIGKLFKYMALIDIIIYQLFIIFHAKTW